VLQQMITKLVGGVTTAIMRLVEIPRLLDCRGIAQCL